MAMDVLKELFGSHDEDFEAHIAKSLFDRQESVQLEAENSRENGSEQLQHANLSKTGDAPEKSALLPSQPAFPPLSISSHSGADIGSVPEEMPMYLLEDDEGNDEEIIRLLGTSKPPTPCSSVVPQLSSQPDPLPPPQPSERSRSSNVSVVFPWMGSTFGMNVTPVQLVPSSPQPKKKRHGGGWPKGKSRKANARLPLPPKPPTSGYGLFLSEHMAEEKLKVTSMSQVSKQLGKLWSSLSSEKKQVYYQKSEQERQRYLTELKLYLLATREVCHEDVDKVLARVVATESDDKLLTCDICKLHFTSLHNKRCHYSGKLHSQTLMELIRPQQSSATCGNSLVTQVCSEAAKFGVCSDQLRDDLRNYRCAVDRIATLQQTAYEQEFLYSESKAVLNSLKEQWRGLCDQLSGLFCSPALDSLQRLYSDLQPADAPCRHSVAKIHV